MTNPRLSDSARMYRVQQAAAAVSVLKDAATRHPDTWDGHPAASYAWVRAAAQIAPRHQWAVLGSHTEPMAFLTMRARFHSPLLYPVGYHHGGFQSMHGHDSEGMVDALARLSRWYAAYLPFCTCELAFALKARAAAVRIREHDVAPVVECGSPDEYLASRPRKLRATIRRAEQAFAELGGVIECVPLPDVLAVIPQLAVVEAQGHRVSGHIFNGRHAAFLHAALMEFREDGVLELWAARIAQSYVGYLVAIRGPRSTYLWTMGITEKMAALSLGSAIFSRAITYNLGQKRWVNLGTGGTPFKHRFATGERQLYDVLLTPSYTVGARQLVSAMPETKHGGRWQ